MSSYKDAYTEICAFPSCRYVCPATKMLIQRFVPFPAVGMYISTSRSKAEVATLIF